MRSCVHYFDCYCKQTIFNCVHFVSSNHVVQYFVGFGYQLLDSVGLLYAHCELSVSYLGVLTLFCR